jgi:hypothetical protein
MRLFCGYDEREAIGYDVFVKSVLRRASNTVHIERIDSAGIPEGSNAFTFSRFLVPYLCGYQGYAVFADASDMLCLKDVAELEWLFDPGYAVQVVKHDYKTRHPIKYVGTEMECPNINYARKNWASFMLINCEHPGWRAIDAAYINSVPLRHMLQMQFLRDDDIGALPDRWNRLADEGQPIEGASILHWTAGTPAFYNYRNTPGADLWRKEHAL